MDLSLFAAYAKPFALPFAFKFFLGLLAFYALVFLLFHLDANRRRRKEQEARKNDLIFPFVDGEYRNVNGREVKVDSTGQTWVWCAGGYPVREGRVSSKK